MKIARTMNGYYNCKHEWSDDCFVQGGDSGIVFKTPEKIEPNDDLIDIMKKATPLYTTAFFEAFPNDIGGGTFIRGEGKTIEESENQCWLIYQKQKNCLGHEYERRGRTDTYGYCKHCNLFAEGIFQYLTFCSICGIPCNTCKDKNGDMYCGKHKHLIPYELKTEIMLKCNRLHVKNANYESLYHGQDLAVLIVWEVEKWLKK